MKKLIPLFLFLCSFAHAQLSVTRTSANVVQQPNLILTTPKLLEGGGGTDVITFVSPSIAASFNLTMPNAASTLPIFGQQVTFTGPTAARSYALPDANATFLYSGGPISGTTGTFSALTSGRVPFVSTAGLLTDEAAFAYNSGTNTLTIDSLTANSGTALTLNGNGAGITINPGATSQDLTVNLNGTGQLKLLGSTGQLIQSATVANLTLNSTAGSGKSWSLQSYTDGAFYITNTGVSDAAKFTVAATTIYGNLTVSGTAGIVSAGAATGILQVTGVTSGAYKITGADAMGQIVTTSVAAQTSGASTLTIPDMAGVSDTYAFLAKAQTFSGIKTFSAAPVLNALPTGSAVASAATASTLASRDASANLSADSFVQGYTTTATAAGTTTLTVDSTGQQFFTGSTTQTVVLPVTSTLVLGQTYRIANNSSGLVTVQSSGANAIIVMGANTSSILTCILTSGTSAASWSSSYFPQTVVAGTANQIAVTNSGIGGTTLSLVSSAVLPGSPTVATAGTAAGSVATIDGTQILTNKRKTPRVLSAASYTTDTGSSINSDAQDIFIVTAQAGALKFNNPTGAPTDGQTLWLAVTGTAARALTYDTQYEASSAAALPSVTITTARTDIAFVWRADTSKWHCVGVTQ